MTDSGGGFDLNPPWPTPNFAGPFLVADFFHLLFRDKILDLTAAFPADARIIDPDTKQEGLAGGASKVEAVRDQVHIGRLGDEKTGGIKIDLDGFYRKFT